MGKQINGRKLKMVNSDKFNDGEFYYQSTDGWCTKVHLIGSFTDFGYCTMAVFRYVSPITRRSVVLLASYDSGKVEGEGTGWIVCGKPKELNGQSS